MKTRASRITPAVEPDPFRFGWRYVAQSGSNGCTVSVRQPLTPEDVLHPQENDTTPENTLQLRDRTYLFDVLKARMVARTGTLVLSDCLINWGVPGMRNSSPDVCVMENVRDPDRLWKTFGVVKEGARPVLAIDIVSVDEFDPRLRDNDVKIKVREYYRARVPLYAIVDWEDENGPRQLRGYRRGKRRYEAIPVDEQGRLPLESVGLVLALRDDRVVCFDAATDEEIPDFTGMARARQEAELGRQQAEEALAAAQARIRELEAQVQRRRRPRGPNA